MSIAIQPPTGKQAWSIATSNARINLWDGAVRSGKTFASIWRWIRFVVEGPAGPLMMVGKTERTLKRNILDPIAELIGEAHFRIVSGSGECFIFGRKVLLVGANDERSEGKIRGITLVGAYGDEVTLWPESFFTMLLSRLSMRGAAFFGTTNPDTPGHWLHKHYLARAGQLDLRRYQFRLEDNPALDPAYVAALKAEYTGLWYRRFILGEWCVAEGAVYDMFDPAIHVVSALPAQLGQAVVGIDYGTSNPTVFELLGQTPATDHWTVTREHYYDARAAGRQKTDAEHARDLLAFLDGTHPQSIEVDPSAASFKAQLRQEKLPRIRDAQHEVLDGIRVVSRALAGGQLVIHRSCTHLIEELQGYTWDPKAQARGEDKPMKVNDHCVDSVRYAAMRIWGRGGLAPVALPRGR